MKCEQTWDNQAFIEMQTCIGKENCKAMLKKTGYSEELTSGCITFTEM